MGDVIDFDFRRQSRPATNAECGEMVRTIVVTALRERAIASYSAEVAAQGIEQLVLEALRNMDSIASLTLSLSAEDAASLEVQIRPQIMSYATTLLNSFRNEIVRVAVLAAGYGAGAALP